MVWRLKTVSALIGLTAIDLSLSLTIHWPFVPFNRSNGIFLNLLIQMGKLIRTILEIRI